VTAWIVWLGASSLAAAAEAPGSWIETQKITASDGQSSDLFGSAIAAWEGTVVFGIDRTAGGAAHVYERRGDGSWQEVQKVLEPIGEGLKPFGFSVALSADTLLVGAHSTNPAGAVVVYEREADGAWERRQTLTPSDGQSSDLFGVSLALDGDVAIIGANYDDDRGDRSGTAFVFERIAGTWVEVQKLIAPDGDAGDEFGVAVGLYADVAVVGSWLDDDLGEHSGAAYVFERQPTGDWISTQKLIASDGGADDRVGTALAISSSAIVLGAEFADPNGERSGAAYVFERGPDDRWSETQRLDASDPKSFGWFGTGLAISDEMLVVGSDSADGQDTSTGAVYIFERQPDGQWNEIQKVSASDGIVNDEFGASVALLERTLIVGAPDADPNGNRSGASYIFTPEQCTIELASDREQVAAGEDLRIQLALEHRRLETAEVPFHLWIEDEEGGVVLQQTIRNLRFEFEDTWDRELSLTIPETMVPGSYRLLAGAEEMLGGVAWAEVAFEVTK